ncbi:septal ring lytic transglycosylase RlpA family protein [Halosquirtibacter xylanolyticus]|uniref:septal ring lytic transglycosylase RlpA family protein n=1 Tax=Halosquirtibacter xylanolyticus TaxID=3374599 RepID=UPI003749D5DE|nr:septal ring lytic transglycosylase RlpA family protein [Prolixibacteraceae bacterium]
MIRKLLLLLFITTIHVTLYGQKIGWHQTGEASYYGKKFHGKHTANGERFSMWKYTAAHKKLPFNTVVRVDSDISKQSVVVRINDRGPYAHGRIIDLSKMAASKIDMLAGGHHKVTITIVPPSTPLGPTSHKTTRTSSPNIPKAITPKKVNKNIFKVNCSVEHITKVYYGVQICGFENITNMLPFIEKAKKESQQIYVDTTLRDGKTFYRICLGKFNSRYEAEKLKNKVRRKYKGCFVINYSN